MQYYTVLSLGCLILPLQCTKTCQKYPVTVIFYYIFHINPQLFQSQFLFDFDEIFTNRNEHVVRYIVFCDYFKIFFGSTDFKCSWFKHKFKLFVFKCTIIVLYFWRSKFSFVFKSWTHKNYKFILKLQCKTTFNSVFIGKKIIKIEQESTLE
jgi:hypothetical protein